MLRTIRPTAPGQTCALTCAAAIVLAALAALHAASPATAPSPSTAPATTQPAGPEVTTMPFHPAAVTQPALARRLLPDVADQTPGDAVPLHLLARRFWPDQKTTTDILYPENEKYDYLATPTDEFPRPYADRLLAGYAQTLRFVDLAARRREAHWDVGWRETRLADNDWLSYLNDMRHHANLLAFRVRYQLSRGDWAGAEYTMQTAFSMARQLGEEPTMVHALVETGFTEIMLFHGVEEWVSRPASPNLYWALSDLPRSYIDTRPVAQWEQFVGRYWKPRLDQAVRGELPPDGWAALVRDAVGDTIERRPPYKRPDPAAVEAEARRLVERVDPTARRALAAAGLPADRVAAMSADEATGTYWAREYRVARDEAFKAWSLPYLEGEAAAARAWEAIAPGRPPAADNPLIQAMLVGGPGEAPADVRLPHPWRARYQFTRVDRHIAVLRTIEAVRDYAAAHDGRPPDRLDQITDLPVPADPFTGKPFPYRFDGRTIVLEAPAPEGRRPRAGWRYELSVGK